MALIEVVIVMKNDNSEAKSLFPIDFVSHDIVEVISSYKTVFVKIGFCENVVDLIFSKLFSQFGSDFLEFMDCDFSLNKMQITDLLTSNDPQTFSISALLSFSPSLAVASLKNSAKSIPPD